LTDLSDSYSSLPPLLRPTNYGLARVSGIAGTNDASSNPPNVRRADLRLLGSSSAMKFVLVFSLVRLEEMNWWDLFGTFS